MGGGRYSNNIKLMDAINKPWIIRYNQKRLPLARQWTLATRPPHTCPLLARCSLLCTKCTLTPYLKIRIMSTDLKFKLTIYTRMVCKLCGSWVRLLNGPSTLRTWNIKIVHTTRRPRRDAPRGQLETRSMSALFTSSDDDGKLTIK